MAIELQFLGARDEIISDIGRKDTRQIELPEVHYLYKKFETQTTHLNNGSKVAALHYWKR